MFKFKFIYINSCSIIFLKAFFDKFRMQGSLSANHMKIFIALSERP